MRLLLQTDNLLKVRVVYVCVHPKQPLEYRLYHVPEVHRKWSPCRTKSIEKSLNDEGVIVKQDKIRMIRFEKGSTPIFWGKMASSSSCPSIQSMRYSTYLGAETSKGFLIVTPSAHRYSYL